MASQTNFQVLLARRPDGAPKPDDFDVRSGPIRVIAAAAVASDLDGYLTELRVKCASAF